MHHGKILERGSTRGQQHTILPPKGSKIHRTVEKREVGLIDQPGGGSLPDQFTRSPLAGTARKHYQQGDCDLESLTYLLSISKYSATREGTARDPS